MWFLCGAGPLRQAEETGEPVSSAIGSPVLGIARVAVYATSTGLGRTAAIPIRSLTLSNGTELDAEVMQGSGSVEGPGG